MGKKKDFIITTNKKTGDRYIYYDGKRYKIQSDSDTNELLKNIKEIIKLLVQKKRRATIRKKKAQAPIAETTGTSTGLIELNNLRKAQNEELSVKYAPTYKQEIPKGQLLITYPNGTVQLIDEGEAKGLIQAGEENPALKERIRKQKEEAEKKRQENIKKIKIENAKSYVDKHYQKAFQVLFGNKTWYINGQEVKYNYNGRPYIASGGNVAKVALLNQLNDDDYLVASDQIETFSPGYKTNIENLLHEENPADTTNFFDTDGNDNTTIAILPPVSHEDEVISTSDPNNFPPGTDPIPPPPPPDNPQVGDGAGNNGLLDSKIAELMRDVPGFKGVYALDELKNVSKEPGSFIYNTFPRAAGDGHWIACIITPDTIEHYDSFGEEPPAIFIDNFKNIGKQFKINNVKFQDVNSSNCGYFAMKFIRDRLAGKSFKDCTGWTIVENSVKGEKAIEKFKKHIKQFETL